MRIVGIQQFPADTMAGPPPNTLVDVLSSDKKPLLSRVMFVPINGSEYFKVMKACGRKFALKSSVRVRALGKGGFRLIEKGKADHRPLNTPPWSWRPAQGDMLK